jgi:hypothetical protein
MKRPTVPYPTKREVVHADLAQLLYWWRELAEPCSEHERRVVELIFKKLIGLGAKISCPSDYVTNV